MKTTIIDLLRHGEPEGGRMYRGGGTDHPLNETGWQQMQASLEKNQADWNAVVTSPMLRCKAFALDVAEKNKIPAEVIENFREAGYGNWEGKTPAQIKQQSAQEYWNFFADPVNNRPENAESLDIFTGRVNSGFVKVLADYQDQHILMVSHLGVTRALLGIILGMPLASQQLIDLPFAGMLRIINDNKGLRIMIR